MTVIAYDGTTLASDRLLSFGDGTYCEVRKIFQRSDGVIYGVAGSGPSVQAAAEWFEHGGNPADFPELHGREENNHFELLYIDTSGGIYLLMMSPHPIKIESTRFAIGCASEAALVLMDMGLTAELAVQKVAEGNLFVGCGVNTLRVG